MGSQTDAHGSDHFGGFECFPDVVVAEFYGLRLERLNFGGSCFGGSRRTCRRDEAVGQCSVFFDKKCSILELGKIFCNF